MLRLCLILVAALYAGFVIWGDAESTTVAEADDAAPVLTEGTGSDFERPVILAEEQANGAVVTRAAVTETLVPDAAVIAASAPAPETSQGRPRLIGEPRVVSLVQPGAPAPAATAPDAAPNADLLRVTGSRVNMRSGPSTGNAVVGSLTQGSLAEAIGEERNGWIEIRDVATGRTGFMAARFLAPS